MYIYGSVRAVNIDRESKASTKQRVLLITFATEVMRLVVFVPLCVSSLTQKVVDEFR